MLKFNKGAMFGLDARIALAIFGALSVISGAALYSAIQNSKATSLLSKMNEVGKAWEVYYLDTGVNLPQSELSDNANYKFYQLRSNYLVEDSGAAGWRGPYISYNVHVDGEMLNEESNTNIYLTLVTKEETWGDDKDWDAGSCVSGKQCYNAIFFSGNDESIAVLADKQVDNGDGAGKGNFRWYTKVDSKKTRALLVYAPVKNPND
ncbi:MAG TPA: hypothetical protein DCL21_00810 [Alphaproteobacteria bacterium]|nr:hypothetical protein [Alphaproteobacteria bacterium]